MTINEAIESWIPNNNIEWSPSALSIAKDPIFMKIVAMNKPITTIKEHANIQYHFVFLIPVLVVGKAIKVTIANDITVGNAAINAVNNAL